MWRNGEIIKYDKVILPVKSYKIKPSTVATNAGHVDGKRSLG